VDDKSLIYEQYLIITEIAESKANIARFIKQYKCDSEDAIYYIQRFNAVSDLIQGTKDIYIFKTLSDLNIYLDGYERELQSRQEKKRSAINGAVKVFSTDKVQIYRIDNTEAAIKMARGTNWCIAADSNKNKYNEYSVTYTIYYVNISSSTSPDYAVLVEKHLNLDAKKSFISHHAWDKNNVQTYYNMFIKDIASYVPTPNRILKYVKKEWKDYTYILNSKFSVDSIVEFAIVNKIGRIPELEEWILKAVPRNYLALKDYAKYVIKGRWPEAERLIAKDRRVWKQYKLDISAI